MLLKKLHTCFLVAAWMATSASAQDSQPHGSHWYRGNTHTHTLNSDGDSAPDEVARWYRQHGYQFVFITDHDYLTDVRPLNETLGATEQFLVLSGQELTLKDVAHGEAQLTVTIQPPTLASAKWLPPRYRTEFIGRNGEVLASVGGLKAIYRFRGSESYVRAVITDSMGKKAWTQPVFLDARKGRSPYMRMRF